MRLTSESALFFFSFFFLHPSCRANTVRSCVCVLTYVFACTHACSGLSSSRFPQCTIGPGGREGERDQKRVSHPADERVKVKAVPSQKKKKHHTASSLTFFFFFEVVQEEGGKRHTFPIALKHGVRQLPSCCTL